MSPVERRFVVSVEVPENVTGAEIAAEITRHLENCWDIQAEVDEDEEYDFTGPEPSPGEPT